MKLYIVFFVLFFVHDLNLVAQDGWLVARMGFVINKAAIVENPDDFYFDAEIETSSVVELTYAWEKGEFEYEVGFGFLEIRSFIAHENDRELYGFGRGASGEIYNYYYFPARMKRRYHVSKWFSLTGGVEGSFMFFSNDNLFLLEGNESCFSVSDRPFLSCSLSDNIEKNKLVFGAGLNTSMEFSFSRFRVSLFGKRDWRIGKGYQQNVTTEIRSLPSMNVLESHSGSMRPILHTWNIGVGLGYRF